MIVCHYRHFHLIRMTGGIAAFDLRSNKEAYRWPMEDAGMLQVNPHDEFMLAVSRQTTIEVCTVAMFFYLD